MPPAIVALQKNYPSINEFLVAYSPDRQTEICYAPEACYFGDSPTLATLTSCYGRGAAEAWLVPEIIDACLFFGLKEQPDTYQLEKLARIIVTNFGYLNVDEVQLFFFYFCSARYRHFYNTFDPSIIILSLRDFLRDRGHAYEEREQREREREREEWKKNAITHGILTTEGKLITLIAFRQWACPCHVFSSRGSLIPLHHKVEGNTAR